MRLAAGFCPDPLGELQCSPDPLAAIGERGSTSKEKKIEKMGGKGEGYKREGRGLPPLCLTSGYGPVLPAVQPGVNNVSVCPC